MTELFEDKSTDEKIEYIKERVVEARQDCLEQNIYNAEILDFFDYWVPWLISEIQLSKEY